MTTETETKPALSPEQQEFAAAMKARRKETGRYFPTWAEVMTVVESLGYRRPCSCAEQDFKAATAAWKRETGIMFPRWAQVLDVLRGIGYSRPEEAR